MVFLVATTSRSVLIMQTLLAIHHLHLINNTVSHLVLPSIPLPGWLRYEENIHELRKHATTAVHASKNATKHGRANFAERTALTASTKKFPHPSMCLCFLRLKTSADTT
jgi:hypothetical protein